MILSHPVVSHKTMLAFSAARVFKLGTQILHRESDLLDIGIPGASGEQQMTEVKSGRNRSFANHQLPGSGQSMARNRGFLRPLPGS
jgi:hypothetical protein